MISLVERSKVAVGVDLGQSKDPTSIAVIERLRWEPADNCPASLVAAAWTEAKAKPRRYNLRLLEQAPLGEPYPAQAQRVKRILARESIAKHQPRVFVDYTGVGRAVFDIFRAEKVPFLVPITITFSGNAPNEAGGHSVPKIDLISRLQALMHKGELFMSDAMPLTKVFRRELLDFRVSFTGVGNATFGAREGAHDDLVLAVALAAHGLDEGREAQVGPLRV